MQPFFDKIAAYPLAQKVGGLAFLIVLLGAGYWYFQYGDLQQRQEAAERDIAEKTTKKEGYEKREREYNQYRNEVNDLLEQQKELFRVLPSRDDIEQFIENVQAQIELSGLSKVTSVREPAVPLDMYTKIPIKMTLSGTYHQINHFFKNVGDLKRIVNIEDLELVPSATQPAQNNGDRPLLTAKFVASTFQFNDKKGAGPQGGAQNITITGGGQ